MTWQFSGCLPRGRNACAGADGSRPPAAGGPRHHFPDDDPDAYDYDYHDYADPDIGAEDGYYYDDSRWKWLGWLAAAVLVVAVVATAVILNGGDSGSTAGRVVPSISPPSTSPPPIPTTSLPAETVITVTPSAPPSPTSSSPPQPTAPAGAPAPLPAPAPQVDPTALVYTVSGTKQPGDIITVTYTDGTGALRTDFNVALPWRKSIVPERNLLLNSVTAASFISRLNCTITDGTGYALVSQSYNTIVTTCNR